MYKNGKATQFHSTITLIQGCLIKKKSWGDEDVIVEERSRNYRCEWIGLQERKEKRMKSNWAISGNTPMHLEWGNKGSFESRHLGTYLNKPKWEKKSIIVEVHNYFNKKRIEYDNRIFKRKMFQIIWPHKRQKGNDDVLWVYGKGYWVLTQAGNSESPSDNQMTSYTNIVSIKLLKGKKEREKTNKKDFNKYCCILLFSNKLYPFFFFRRILTNGWEKAKHKIKVKGVISSLRSI